jgi:uncharacterized protein (TIGR02266 family)
MSNATASVDPAFSDEKGRPRRTILVVDDAPIFREMEIVFLGRTANILTAADGGEALEIALRERPDLIVTDLSMGEFDGDELCRRIRSHPDLRRTPVVIVTSGLSGDEHERAVRAGADDVVKKPLNRLSLLQAVNRLLRHTLRGLTRVPLETDVRVQAGGTETWAWSRNVSRGGIFIETDGELEPDTELALEFRVPDSKTWIHPTARVIWRRALTDGERAGIGLQFLKLEPGASGWLEEYVYELAPPPDADVPAAGAS